MLLGPVMLDVAGFELTAEDREILRHPQIGGVILFTRNYHDINQLKQLIQSIKTLRDPALLIAVDHEGGRVQRFRNGFTHLPAMRKFGEIYNQNSALALQLTEQCGWLMAVELLAVGVDFSFAPVVDLEYNVSQVIGDRSFHADPQIVSQLSAALVTGMRKTGMSAVAKHFPGHGAVAPDSHLEIPIDTRELNVIEQADIIPFTHLIKAGIAGIMPAHVIYSKVDNKPAGFSTIWLQKILRKQLHFDGVIFSDCLTMIGASIIGDFPQRAEQALAAGCDMVLVCNNRDAAITILDSLNSYQFPSKLQERWENMRCRSTQLQQSDLHSTSAWRDAVAQMVKANLIKSVDESIQAH